MVSRRQFLLGALGATALFIAPYANTPVQGTNSKRTSCNKTSTNSYFANYSLGGLYAVIEQTESARDQRIAIRLLTERLCERNIPNITAQDDKRQRMLVAHRDLDLESTIACGREKPFILRRESQVYDTLLTSLGEYEALVRDNIATLSLQPVIQSGTNESYYGVMLQKELTLLATKRETRDILATLIHEATHEDNSKKENAPKGVWDEYLAVCNQIRFLEIQQQTSTCEREQEAILAEINRISNRKMNLAYLMDEERFGRAFEHTGSADFATAISEASKEDKELIMRIRKLEGSTKEYDQRMLRALENANQITQRVQENESREYPQIPDSNNDTIVFI